jgi:hypothetical protein
MHIWGTSRRRYADALKLLCGGVLANARPAALLALAFYALVLADAQPIALLSLKKKRQCPRLLDPSHCMAFFWPSEKNCETLEAV